MSIPLNDNMQKPKIHIIARDVFRGDAIGNFVLDLHRFLEKNNIEKTIYSENFRDEKKIEIKDITSLPKLVRKIDLIFYNFSIYDPYLPIILDLSTKKIMYYHGITPPDLMQKYDPITSESCEMGLKQLISANKFDRIVCNSEFSAKQLLENSGNTASTTKIAIYPPIINSAKTFRRFTENEDEQEAKSVLLYVGRIAPHKRIELLVDLLKEYKKKVPDAVLHLVGKDENQEYNKYIEQRINENDLKIDIDIKFQGFVPENVLEQEYLNADFFVTLSAHEGFCVPLFEAMNYNLPILTVIDGAIPETMKYTGYQFHSEKIEEMAEYLIELRKNNQLKHKIISLQKKRRMELCQESNGKALLEIVNKMLF